MAGAQGLPKLVDGETSLAARRAPWRTDFVSECAGRAPAELSRAGNGLWWSVHDYTADYMGGLDASASAFCSAQVFIFRRTLCFNGLGLRMRSSTGPNRVLDAC